MPKHTILSLLFLILLCSCGGNASKQEITADMAFEGISNYCHTAYDWDTAEADSSVMYVEMGEETDSAYQVIFRSYTGALVIFYVNKTDGTTKIEEYVPALDIREDAGTIHLLDYLDPV